MIVFRHTDPRFPFLWEDPSQPPGRWHGEGEGPAHYFADTPYGAWAELVRHEEIVDPADLAGLRRALWAVELPEVPEIRPELPESTMQGGTQTYPSCRAEARRLRSEGASALRAPSAALLPGGARGWIVESGLRPGPERDGEIYALFGPRRDLAGWPVVVEGRPPADVLERVRQF